MVPPCFVSEQTIGGFGISTADPAVETVFVDTGRIFVNDYLCIRISLEQRFLNLVGIVMRLIQRKGAIQFQMEFEHIFAAEVAGAQVMDAVGKIVAEDDFFDVQANFVVKLPVGQQSDGVARQFVGVVQQIGGNGKGGQRIKPTPTQKLDDNKRDDDGEVGCDVDGIVGAVGFNCL